MVVLFLLIKIQFCHHMPKPCCCGFLNDQASDRKILRLGAVSPTSVNVRVVAATNMDLKKLVSEGKFKADLYYRLNVAQINLSPLRDRPSEKVPLARHFLKMFSEKYNKRLQFFDRAAEQYIQISSWPGNIRQLSNLIERSVINSSNSSEELRKSDLLIDNDLEGSELSTLLDTALANYGDVNFDRITAVFLRDAYIKTGGIKKEAAEILGLQYNTFRLRWDKARQNYPELFPVNIFGPRPLPDTIIPEDNVETPRTLDSGPH
jgi:transcriptional regulator with PAS, ATPase and Fis domain